MKILNCIILPIVLFALIGCGGSSSDDQNDVDSSPNQESSKDYSEQVKPTSSPVVNIEFDKITIDVAIVDKFLQPTTVFSSEDDVVVEVVATNMGDDAYQFYTSGPIMNLAVLNSDGEEVWSQYHGRAFPAVVTVNELGSGVAHESEYTWEIKDNEGSTLEPGTYYIDLNRYALLNGTDASIPLIAIEIN